MTTYLYSEPVPKSPKTPTVCSVSIFSDCNQQSKKKLYTGIFLTFSIYHASSLPPNVEKNFLLI